METKQRIIKHLTDEHGHRIVHVPLDDEGKNSAIVNEVMFQDLIDLGMSPIWMLKLDRKQRRVVFWNTEIGQHTSVARVIADAGPKQAVSYANRDPLDLRVGNLVIGPGKAKRRDRTDVRPSTRANYQTIVRHVYINPINKEEELTNE